MYHVARINIQPTQHLISHIITVQKLSFQNCVCIYPFCIMLSIKYPQNPQNKPQLDKLEAA